MQGIKNIIFDLGGVLLNIDYNLSVIAFEKIGLKNFNSFYSKKEQNELFDNFETGKIPAVDFIKEIKKKMPPTTLDIDIIDSWNAMLLDFPLVRLQLLQQLQLHYNLYLLSNTNEIHEAAFNKILNQTCGYPSLAVFFDKVYFSHRIGMRKPTKEIFEKVIHDNRLKVSETLFIDDSIQHIQGANSIGLQTIHLTNEMTIEKDIFKIIQ